MVGERYQLLERLASANSAILGVWRGQDTVLNRPVTITIAEPGGGSAAVLLGHAHALSLIEHPSLPRVFDAADEGRRAWVVTEWIDGNTLGSMLVDGPFDARATAAAVARLAEGVALAHRAGLTVGFLDPDHVAITPRGSVTVTRLAVEPQSRLDDVRLLGALVYVMLTGQWPPLRHGAAAVAPPGQIQPGIPADLDEITMRAIHAGDPSGFGSASEVAESLTRWHDTAEVEPPPILPATPQRYVEPTRRRRFATVAAFVAGFCAIALTALVVSNLVGGKSGEPPQAAAHADSPTQEPSTDPTSPPASATTPIVIKSVAMYDPQGDGQENAKDAPRAIDHDPQTAWETLQYKRSPLFGNLKSGVGLIFDLGSATEVREVDITTTEPGTDIEIRIGDQANGALDSYRVVGQQSALPAHAVITLQPGASGRYVVVWFTKLVPVGSEFQGNLAEVAFRS